MCVLVEDDKQKCLSVGNALKNLAFNVLHVLQNALGHPKCLCLEHLNIKIEYLSKYEMEAFPGIKQSEKRARQLTTNSFFTEASVSLPTCILHCSFTQRPFSLENRDHSNNTNTNVFKFTNQYFIYYHASYFFGYVTPFSPYGLNFVHCSFIVCCDFQDIPAINGNGLL